MTWLVLGMGYLMIGSLLTAYVIATQPGNEIVESWLEGRPAWVYLLIAVSVLIAPPILAWTFLETMRAHVWPDVKEDA